MKAEFFLGFRQGYWAGVICGMALSGAFFLAKYFFR
jgi:hypothetical protein